MTTIEDLPKEVLRDILDLLESGKDLAYCCRVCRLWKTICSSLISSSFAHSPFFLFRISL